MVYDNRPHGPMRLWRGLAAVGTVALVVAVAAFGGTVLAVEPLRPLTVELWVVATVAFSLGAAGLAGAVVARGVSQVNRAVGLARRAE